MSGRLPYLLATIAVLAVVGCHADDARKGPAGSPAPPTGGRPSGDVHPGGAIGNYLAPRMAVKVAAEEVAMRSDLSNVMVAMESYSASHGSYAPTLDALQMVASDGVTITLSGVSETGYTATASHVRLATTRCVLTVATGSAEATTCTH